MDYHFTAPVWGDYYRSWYLDLCLPCQLGAMEGGFPFERARYFIYTTKADVQPITEHAAYKALSERMPVEFVLSEKPEFYDCHRTQVRRAFEAGAANFFLDADQIWGAHSFTNAAKQIDAGYDAVMVSGPRIVDEFPRDLFGTGLVREASARDIVKATFGTYLHPETQVWFWDYSNYAQYPRSIYFGVPNEGVLVLGFLLCPLVVKPVSDFRDFRIFDQDYITRACPDPSKVYVCQDSDEMCQVSIAPRSIPADYPDHDPSRDPIQAMAWHFQGDSPLYPYFSRYPVRLHHADLSQAWQSVEAKAHNIGRSVSRLLEMPTDELVLVSPRDVIERYRKQVDAYNYTLSAQDEAIIALAKDMINLRQHKPAWHR